MSNVSKQDADVISSVSAEKKGPSVPVDQLTDDELMTRLAGGDKQALAILYRRYKGLTKTVVGRFAPEASLSDLEELVQEVFLAVNDAASRYEQRQRFKSWLYSIAIRKTKNWQRYTFVRRRFYKQNHNRYVAVALPFGVGSEEQAEMSQELGQALSRLSPKLREVFLLCEVEGLSHEEIAQVLGIKIQAVWARRHRARKQLSALLKGKER